MHYKLSFVLLGKPVRILPLSLVLVCAYLSVYLKHLSDFRKDLFLSSFILKREELMTADQSGDVREVLRRTAQFCFCSDFWILFGSQPVSLQSHLDSDSRA